MASLFLAYAATFALVVARIAGYVVSSPFPGPQVSTTQRVGLVCVLSWIATMFASAAETPREIDLRLFGGVAVNLGCGLVIGLAFQLVFTAAEILGQVLSQAVGLSSPSALNPTIGAQDMVLSRIVSLFGLLVALGAGTHRIAIAYLLESFRVLPVSSVIVLPSTSMYLIDLAISSYGLGVRLALPVVALGLIVQLALAMIARAAPSLQIFSVGFGVLLASGFAALFAGFGEMMGGLTEHLEGLGPRLDALLLLLQGRTP